MTEYPTRESFVNTVATWLDMWLKGRMGDKEFRARLAAIAECPVKEEPVPERVA